MFESGYGPLTTTGPLTVEGERPCSMDGGRRRRMMELWFLDRRENVMDNTWIVLALATLIYLWGLA